MILVLLAVATSALLHGRCRHRLPASRRRSLGVTASTTWVHSDAIPGQAAASPRLRSSSARCAEIIDHHQGPGVRQGRAIDRTGRDADAGHAGRDAGQEVPGGIAHVPAGRGNDAGALGRQEQQVGCRLGVLDVLAIDDERRPFEHPAQRPRR